MRRPTGGSAILHDDELTYSLAAPEDDPHLRGDILASYHSISLVLARAWRTLGLAVTLAPGAARTSPRTAASRPAPAPRPSRTPAPCFIRPAGYEILADGRKLVGSAQMRRAGALLQHGAIPLAGDVAAITELLAMPAAGPGRASASGCARTAITAGEAAGRPVRAPASWRVPSRRPGRGLAGIELDRER